METNIETFFTLRKDQNILTTIIFS